MTRDDVLTRAQDTLLSGPESILLMLALAGLALLGIAWLIDPEGHPRHVRTDPACREYLGDSPPRARGRACLVCKPTRPAYRQPHSLADCIDRRPGRR